MLSWLVACRLAPLILVFWVVLRLMLAAVRLANANNAVSTDNTANTNNGQININSQNLNILSSQDTNNTKSNTKHKNLNGFAVFISVGLIEAY
jgi:hypothetical protein